MTESDLKLTLGQHIVLAIMGRVFLYHHSKPGWAEAGPFYAFRCRDHGLVVSYPHGYGRNLMCPICQTSEGVD